ncbi:MAG: glycosyltransferase [Thermoguttaceae bacterium]|nr:glycosyltransferase [Thermoguttaceae bacterium]
MRLLFASPHNYLDQTSGAAISTRESLLALVRAGWDVRVVCGAIFDNPRTTETDHLLKIARKKTPTVFREGATKIDGRKFPWREVDFNDCGIAATVFVTDDALDPNKRPFWFASPSSEVFYRRLGKALDAYNPDVFATYGGDPRIALAAETVRNRGASTAFYLHNLEYRKPELFKSFDSVIVPSEFAKRFYKEKLGIETVAIPPLIDEIKILADSNSREFVSLVNPALEKGRCFFIGIARELGKLRPEIPFLVVDGRAKAKSIGGSPEGRALQNLYWLPTTDEPRDFYKRTRILLVPSLWEEAFGRTAVEGALNSIPVLVSNRGALPEVVGDPRAVLPIPKRFEKYSKLIPTPEEVAPWVELIVKLWDDDALARKLAASEKASVANFSRKIVEEKTLALFENLVNQKAFAFRNAHSPGEPTPS